MVGRSPTFAAHCRPPPLLFIDGGHAEEAAHADYGAWARVSRRAATSPSTTCSRIPPTAVGPVPRLERAVADGFTPEPDLGRGSLRVLER